MAQYWNKGIPSKEEIDKHIIKNDELERIAMEYIFERMCKNNKNELKRIDAIESLSFPNMIIEVDTKDKILVVSKPRIGNYFEPLTVEEMDYLFEEATKNKVYLVYFCGFTMNSQDKERRKAGLALHGDRFFIESYSPVLLQENEANEYAEFIVNILTDRGINNYYRSSARYFEEQNKKRYGKGKN